MKANQKTQAKFTESGEEGPDTAAPEETEETEETEPTETPVAAETVDGDDTPESTEFTLFTINNSSVPGTQYFNVFPPRTYFWPETPHTVIPSVSPPTVTGNGMDNIGRRSCTAMMWTGRRATLEMIPVLWGQAVETSPRTPVRLGSTVEVAWFDGEFSVTPTDGLGSTITVIFGPGIPEGARLGLVVGPGIVLMRMPVDGGSVEITPDVSPAVRVVFGTANPEGKSDFKDVSEPAIVVFAGASAASAAVAAVTVGPDNRITQIV